MSRTACDISRIQSLAMLNKTMTGYFFYSHRPVECAHSLSPLEPTFLHLQMSVCLTWFALQKETVVNVLKLEDFSVTEKSLIHIDPQKLLDKERLDEDIPMSKMSLPNDYSIENSDNLENPMTLPGVSEYVDLPLLHANFGYVQNCEIQFC